MNKILIAKDAAEKAMAAEARRTESLLRVAGKFAAGIVVVLGFQLLDMKTLLESPSPWVKDSSCISIAILSLALFFAFRGFRLSGYADYPRGLQLWETLKPETVSEAAAEEALVQVLLKAREQNARLNDAKIRALYWCGWLFFAGILLVAGTQLLDGFVDWT
jgi:hypothetical protein